LATVSSTYERAHRMATGMYDVGSFLALPPPLYTGWMRAVLMADGNTSAYRDMLTRCVTGPTSMLDPIWKTDTGISSVPRAEVVFSRAKTFEIRPSLAKPKEKLFFYPLSPSLEVVAAF
jgi:hypothetical protein